MDDLKRTKQDGSIPVRSNSHQKIAESAKISSSCLLQGDIEIGEFSIIEDDVIIGPGCKIHSHVRIRAGSKLGECNEILDNTVIKSHVLIGDNNTIHENCVVGGEPLLSNRPIRFGSLDIGSNNTIREGCTIQVGSQPGMTTKIGSSNYLMPYCQIGHDSTLSDHVTMTNYTGLCGHVTVEEFATLGMGVVVHQHCRIGRFAMVGASAYVSQDVLPYVLIDGRSGQVVGLNTVGLKRQGFQPEKVRELKKIYQLIFRSGLRFENLMAELETNFPQDVIEHICGFLLLSERGWVRERRRSNRSRALSGQQDMPDIRLHSNGKTTA